ncbi:hypothetical protein [Azospirillum sp. A39]|uniref:hypothetical protein n=1 Tax=Azospirillum sp. A39 TaxID=3462279 RepID=UPI00404622E0
MPKKTVVVHYRRMEHIGEPLPGTTLEAACREAFCTQIDGTRIADRLRHRIWTRDQAGEDYLFANFYHDDGASLFGDVTHFTKGHMQALFQAGLIDEPVVPIRQMPAPEDMEYIHSIMYWLIVSNHVFILQSQSLKTRTLEDYLTWLISDKAATRAKPFQIVLSSKFDPAAVGGDLSNITGITIGGIIAPGVEADGEVEGPAQHVLHEAVQRGAITARRASAFAQAREILSTLLGGSAQADEYLRSVPQEAELSLEVHIGYKSRKRKIDRAPLKALETGLRNLDDGDLKVTARDGHKGPDGDIRLREPVSVETIGALINPVDAREKMLAVYQSLVKNEKIAP